MALWKLPTCKQAPEGHRLHRCIPSGEEHLAKHLAQLRVNTVVIPCQKQWQNSAVSKTCLKAGAGTVLSCIKCAGRLMWSTLDSCPRASQLTFNHSSRLIASKDIMSFVVEIFATACMPFESLASFQLLLSLSIVPAGCM